MAAFPGYGGRIQWDFVKRKYVWVNENGPNHHDRKKAEQEQAKKKITPYGEDQVQAMLKRRAMNLQQGRQNQAKHPPVFQMPGKKACKKPTPTKRKKSKSPSPPRGFTPVKQPRVENMDWESVLSPSAEDRENRSVAANVRKSKDSGVATEEEDALLQLSAGHPTMTKVLSSRLLWLQAALTFWRQSPTALVSYILRINNEALIADVIPILIKSIKNGNAIGKPISMGACLELLPALQKMLTSKYEDYISGSLDLIRTILKHWWKDLKSLQASQQTLKLGLRSRSVNGVYTSIVAMTDSIQKIATRPGNIGQKAQVVLQILKDL
ncbi:PREDICTED: KATNB1-like protein 1 [Branchiostoma belcheri]|uniref:KATNB1-like protein 1 n=1 Tax=Branchiostoma belcheri TaxID=7741 RepID=A0A6P5A373_BRABE|nr:PREDICTED: KATNB1-like protein 1 [Branchiostoma belcheri]